MAFEDYGAYDAVGLAELVRSRQVSARELLYEAIARADRIEPTINAISVRHDDFATRQIDAGLPEGRFSGVPFLLKDLNRIAGTRTTYGCAAYRDYVADRSDTIAERYIAAGLTIFGKTSNPEFGQMVTTEPRLHGPTRNPWNPDHSSGGSSGGAAAAVAARIVPAAHATDGGGSIRVPASACGVFGLKPTRARTPAGPDRSEGWSGFLCGNVVSVSVRDSAALLDVARGPELAGPYRAPEPERPYLEEVSREPGRLRIRFIDKTPAGEAIDPEVAAAVRETAELLADLGHHVEECSPRLEADPMPIARLIVAANSAATVRAAEALFGRPMTGDDIETMTAFNRRLAESVNAVDFLETLQGAFLVSRSLRTFFEDCDVFLCATICRPPARIGELDTMSDDVEQLRARLRGYVPWTSMFNMSGQPSMSVPLAWSRNGLPLGMMFSGKFGEEATLFRLAGQLERVRPWKDRVPPVS